MDAVDKDALCRFCLLTLESGVEVEIDVSLPKFYIFQDIFPVSYFHNHLSRSQYSLDYLQLNSSPHWPGYICMACNSLLEQFCDFRDATLRNWLLILEQFGPGSEEILAELTNYEEGCDPKYHHEHDPIKFEQLREVSNEDENAELASALENSTQKPDNNLYYNDIPMSNENSEIAADNPTMEAVQEPLSRRDRKPRKLVQDKWAISDKNVEDDGIKRRLRLTKKIITEDDHLEQTIRNYGILLCELCPGGKTFSDVRKVLLHYKEAHKTRGYISCCGKKYYRRFTLYGHINVHLNPDKFKCTHCSKSLGSAYGLQLHMDGHVPYEERNFECEVCGIRFARETKLKQHYVFRHVPEEHKQFKCPTCGKAFVSQPLVEDHHRRVHENLRPYVCDICAKLFKTKHILMEHVATHDTNRVRIKCDECGKFYQNELQAKRHKQRAHSGDGMVYECPHCGIHSKNSIGLAQHIKLVHNTDPNKYPCTICNKGFKKTKTLRVSDSKLNVD